LEPGSRPREEEQEPGRERVERAGVARAGPGPPPDRRDDVEGRRPRRLVDEDDSSRLEPPGRHYRSAASPTCAVTSRTMNPVISSTDRSLENPAASRCPPPPDFRAIALTSTSSTDERS